MTVLLLSHLLGCTKRSDNRSPSINHTTPSDNPFALDTPTPQVLSTIPAGDLSCPLFDDVAQQSGLDFTYHNGEAGKSLMVEAIGGGVGWLDIDGDGFWDLYLVQGGDPTAKTHAGQPNDQIFRNHGNGQFVDITSQTRIDQRAYGQGVSIADFDNDGFDDIYITNVGPNTLLQNMGDGTFVDVTQAAGVGGTSWSSSAAWGDLDRDGDVDLYVCNYLDYDPRSPWDCRNSRGEPRICHPRDIDPVPDELFINQGDGTFVSAAPSLGLFGPGNKALGVAICELTGDQYIDIYVANDTEANFLFVGNKNGRFEESALALGCAVDRNGHTQASMGVAVGDYDSDRFDDLYITHFYDESNTLYHSLGPLGFDDVTPRVELHHATLPRLGFGCVMHDFAGNGQQALLIANGHIENFPGNPLLKMKPQLFAWTGQQWHDCSKNAGTFFEKKQVGRGIATADYDNDGDLDAVIVHQNSPLALLENMSAKHHWLGLECIGLQSNRRGIGCKVTLSQGDVTQVQQLRGGTSYASSHQPRLLFGLGQSDAPCTIDIAWPSGIQQTLVDVSVDQLLVATELLAAADNQSVIPGE